MNQSTAPEEATKNSKDLQLENLVSNIFDTLKKSVEKESDLSNILLKGHLLVENFLEELLSVLDLKDDKPIHRKTFNEKLESLKAYVNSKIENTEQNEYSLYIRENVKKLLPALRALNEIRNNLAHDFTFSVSAKDINKVGLNFGSIYILEKYKKGHENLKDNLVFCIKHIVNEIGRNIYHKICDLRARKRGIEESR